jgi:hypothetical protein
VPIVGSECLDGCVGVYAIVAVEYYLGEAIGGVSVHIGLSNRYSRAWNNSSGLVHKAYEDVGIVWVNMWLGGCKDRLLEGNRSHIKVLSTFLYYLKSCCH